MRPDATETIDAIETRDRPGLNRATPPGVLAILFTLVLVASPALGQELGSRVLHLGADSQYFVFVGEPIALGPWLGDLVLEGGVPDAQGVAAVSGSGLLSVDVLAGVQGRICRRFESCVGEIYCEGEFSADITSTLDSMGCQGLGGTGVLPTISSLPASQDSGPGAMTLTCMVSEANFRLPGAMPDCTAVADGDGFESYGLPRPMFFTTGTMTASAINWCGGFETEASLSGANFSCDDWTAPYSGGALVRTTVNEEQDLAAPFDLAGGTIMAATLCGNAVIDAGEVCDDAGESLFCNEDCSASLCNDGLLNKTAGEECENGFACSPGEICTQQCACIAEPVCGNGVPEFGEDCDDGGESALCNLDCSLAICGDGTLNSSAGETCEFDSADCEQEELCGRFCRCVVQTGCGNTFIEPGEECDDGNQMNGDGCTERCTAELPFDLEIANLNLLHALFEDNDIEARLSLTADFLAAVEPDIATFQEVAFVDGRDAQDILIDQLRERHGLVYHGIKYGQTSAGQAVISKWPVEAREEVLLPAIENSPGFSDPRIFGRVVVYSPVGPLDVYAFHFCASCTNAERVVQADEVIDFIATTQESGHPSIIGADFNSHHGTEPDANPVNDPTIERLIEVGYSPFFDGFDAPCNAPGDRSGCTSGQDLRAETDTTTRRIDGIMVDSASDISRAVELGESSTFADVPELDPDPECAFDPPIFCQLSSECHAGSLCDATSGHCTPTEPACETALDCDGAAVCQANLWASDHLGVRTTARLVRVPELGALQAALAAILALAALRRRAF